MDFNPNRSCIFFPFKIFGTPAHKLYKGDTPPCNSSWCRILKITQIKEKREMEEGGGKDGKQASGKETSKFTLRKMTHRLLFRSGKPFFKKPFPA